MFKSREGGSFPQETEEGRANGRKSNAGSKCSFTKMWQILSPSLSHFLSPPGPCQIIIRDSPHQHSCEWAAHCCSLETQQTERLYITFYVRFTYIWRQNTQAPNFHPGDIIIWELQRGTGESAPHLTRHFTGGFGSALAHKVINPLARLDPPTALVINTVLSMWLVFTHSHDAKRRQRCTVTFVFP